MSNWIIGDHGVNSNPAPQLRPRVDGLVDLQAANESGIKDWTKVPMPKTGIPTYVVMGVGALWTLGGLIGMLINRNLGIPIILGIFLILISSVLYARNSRACLNIIRAYCIQGWRNEEVFKAPFGRVLRYTFFSLLPVYCMWCLPVMFGIFVGYTGWLMFGVPFTIISVLVFGNFSYTWKDLEIKLWKFWAMQAGIFIIINGTGLLIYFLGAV